MKETPSHSPNINRGIALISPGNGERIAKVVRNYWGFEQLRPLQQKAIEASIAQRDSLVVMPTGGGKSLCYQVPPIVTNRTDVVVSPLISLMKDQVDALRSRGYPAAALHSGLDEAGRKEVTAELRSGKLRLLFVAPERLVTDGFLQTIKQLKVRSFAVDEAHCISHWGHDFRPEYRQLASLRGQFPDASLHAFTATATPRVRKDIINQLKLNDPHVLVGQFDRPNLIYRILPRVDRYAQTLEVVRRHHGEAVIIYCLSRKDTEAMASSLNDNGIEAAHYHAGMSAEQRQKTQDAFATEELNVIAATVAFGMGIDRSNVRCVLHATMPKSVEHYQQETGRSGRDGLEAECVLFYSAEDVMRWQSLIQLSAKDSPQSTQTIEAQEHLLRKMQGICNTPVCRHKTLSEYFGQAYERIDCGACDVCLNEVEGMEDATVSAQKILSCVARTEQRFGIGHVVEVLLGAQSDRIRRFSHDQLSTYGLMNETPKKVLTSMVYQLIDQGILERTEGTRPILHLNDESWRVLRSQRSVQMLKPKRKAGSRTKIDKDAWEGVHRDLFEQLRNLRRELAVEHGVPPYMIFEDTTLRNLARVRPTSLERLNYVRGIGQQRAKDWGELLVREISTFCRQHNIETDVLSANVAMARSVNRPNASKQRAMEMFAQGHSCDQVATDISRAYSTAAAYLEEWIRDNAPKQIGRWVDHTTYVKVTQAAAQIESNRLKPIFEHLDSKVPYEVIRWIIAHLKCQANAAKSDD